VVDLWAEEYERLGSRPEVGHVQIFENKGQMMGASNPHPHGQIWAQQSVPLAPAREGERMREHFARHGRTLLEDYLQLELRLGERVVCANDAFVALVPFWAVWPFETLVVSRRPAAHLGALTDAERSGFADIVKRVTTRYDNLFEISFPYSAGIHQAPTDGAPHPEWHLHMHFYPPLLRSATVRKFLVGYEMMGEPQRDLTAETAAARLRALLADSPLNASHQGPGCHKVQDPYSLRCIPQVHGAARDGILSARGALARLPPARLQPAASSSASDRRTTPAKTLLDSLFN
jgi:UDPglucose--hexose-1-phosphate uridylyltransferase